MRSRYCWSNWLPLAAGRGGPALVVDGRAWGQQRSSRRPPSDQPKDAEPVVRTFGSEGGFRTEVTSRTMATTERGGPTTVSLLMAQAFEHIVKARDAIDADDNKEALEEVNKSREAIKAIHAMLPKTMVHTKTTAPDGKVVYEDEREVQERRIPLFEGLLHTETLAPILAARRNAMEVAGRSCRRLGDDRHRGHRRPRPHRGSVNEGGQGAGENKGGRRQPRWPRPLSGVSISASTRRTRRWRRPATHSGWRGGLWKRTTFRKPSSTWNPPTGSVADLSRGRLAGRAPGRGPDAPRSAGARNASAARERRRRPRSKIPPGQHHHFVVGQINGWFRGGHSDHKSK